jgi:hypothetical protein
LEQAKGYVNAPQKSTSWILNWREVFKPGAENYSAKGKRQKIVLKVLAIL